MTGTQSNAYEDGVQKDKNLEIAGDKAHDDLDSKDQRSLANRAASAAQAEKASEEAAAAPTDPLAPAKAHGNEPSRGAKVDKEIMDREEEELKRKGKLD